MSEIKVNIKYNDSGILESVSANDINMDISFLVNRPIEQWFVASNGRDGWVGLIPTIQERVNDYSANLIFDFKGPANLKEIFEQELEKQPIKNVSVLSTTSVIIKRLENARKLDKENDYIRAYENYKDAADRGNLSAQLRAGELSYNCFNGSIDLVISKKTAWQNAVKYYKKAADQNSDEAQYFLGKCYYERNSVVSADDLKTAIKYFECSAKQGYVYAQYWLGDYYYNKAENNYNNRKQAFNYFTMAAMQNHAVSLRCVAICYELGEGTKQNLFSAFRASLKTPFSNHQKCDII